MSFDGIKGYNITIEKDGINESVRGTQKYRLYVNGKLIYTSNYYKDIMKRLNAICNSTFEDKKMTEYKDPAPQDPEDYERMKKEIEIIKSWTSPPSLFKE